MADDSFLTIDVVGDREVVERFNGMPAKLRNALERKITTLAASLRDYVITNKLSGDPLKKQTGRLQQSIQRNVTSTATNVTGIVFSAGDVKYAAIHEFGGTIKAHDVFPAKASALAFTWNGKKVFFKHVHIPDVNMPKRSFLRSALQDKQDAIVEGMKEAVMQGART